MDLDEHEDDPTENTVKSFDTSNVVVHVLILKTVQQVEALRDSEHHKNCHNQQKAKEYIH
jgi:hypothetical protein